MGGGLRNASPPSLHTLSVLEHSDELHLAVGLLCEYADYEIPYELSVEEEENMAAATSFSP